MVQGKAATTGGKETPLKTWDDIKLEITSTLILFESTKEVNEYYAILLDMPFNKLEMAKIFAMVSTRIKQISNGQI